MENTAAKPDSGNTGAEENPNNHNHISNGNDSGDAAAVNSPRRTPFTDLSQVDADLALARTLQEQERAYMMLRMGSGGGSDYGSLEAESYGHVDDFDEDDYGDASEEDYNASDVEGVASDEHASTEGEEDDDLDVELDPSAFPDDEAYARALQDVEEREMAANLLALAGLTESIVEEDDEDEEDEDEEDHGINSQDAWEEVDPDELSYEELLALGEVVGTESRAFLQIQLLPCLQSTTNRKALRKGSVIRNCVICRLDYEDGDNLIVLSCKHSYHSECINKWLQINKVCPVCNAEVSTSGRS